MPSFWNVLRNQLRKFVDFVLEKRLIDLVTLTFDLLTFLPLNNFSNQFGIILLVSCDEILSCQFWSSLNRFVRYGTIEIIVIIIIIIIIIRRPFRCRVRLKHVTNRQYTKTQKRAYPHGTNAITWCHYTNFTAVNWGCCSRSGRFGSRCRLCWTRRWVVHVLIIALLRLCSPIAFRY